jgi:hypothetical protein
VLRNSKINAIMKQYGTYWLQKLVLLTSFCLLAGCGSPKIDQSAINRLENGVAGYKKILLDMQNAGLSEAEFKKNWNAANFGLRDAITYLEAKKIHTADLNPMILNDTVDRWSRYLEAYQFGSEGKVWAGSRSNMEVDKPSRMGWDKPQNEADNNCISLSQMIGLIKQFPQLRLLYFNKNLDSSYSEVPEKVQKEILAYVPSDSEPFGFLRYFRDYCSSNSHGFNTTEYDSRVEFSLKTAEVNHLAFISLKSEVEELDRKLKELAK